MKYRIEKSDKGYEPKVAVNDARNGWGYFRSLDKYGRSFYYDTIEEAEKVCREYHIENGYDKLPKIVKEFEL